MQPIFRVSLFLLAAGLIQACADDRSAANVHIQLVTIHIEERAFGALWSGGTSAKLEPGLQWLRQSRT